MAVLVCKYKHFANRIIGKTTYKNAQNGQKIRVKTHRSFLQGERLPSPVLILGFQAFLQFFPVFGKGEAVSVADGFRVDLLRGEAALDARHGLQQSRKASVAVHIVGRKEVLPASDGAESQHLADVGFGVVLVGRRPTGDDVPHREALALPAEAVVVGLKHFPCRPITVGQGGELYKTFIFLLVPGTLPTVGRVSDVERVVVPDSSGCLHVHFILN